MTHFSRYLPCSAGTSLRVTIVRTFVPDEVAAYDRNKEAIRISWVYRYVQVDENMGHMDLFLPPNNSKYGLN